MNLKKFSDLIVANRNNNIVDVSKKFSLEISLVTTKIHIIQKSKC